MPVSTPHPDHAYRKPDWAKLRAFAEGARAVRAAGEAYLPRLSGQSEEDYALYKSRAEVYGAIDRTIDGLEGAIFLKPPHVEVSQSPDAAALLADIDLMGRTLPEWLRAQVREVLTLGRAGVLVDHPPGDLPGARPYLVAYPAERIVNWDTSVIRGVETLTLVVLEEWLTRPAARDPFVRERCRQFRVLRLVEQPTGAPTYRVELWQQQETHVGGVPSPRDSSARDPSASEEFVLISSVEPRRRGAPLDRIPFFFLGATGQSIIPEKPPLLDVAELCHLHYLNSADYQHGLHWVGLPTPWVTGTRDKDTIKIGPSNAIVLESETARVGMLEFTGSGLGALEKRLSDLERKMAILGARILEEQKRSVEAAETVKLRQGGDISTLGAISDAVSRTMEAVLARLLWWSGIDTPDVTVELNMDFQLARLTPAELNSLVQAWQAGALTKETFLWNLKRGQLLPESSAA